MEMELTSCSLLNRFDQSPPPALETTSSTRTSSTPTSTSTTTPTTTSTPSRTNDTSTIVSASSSKSSGLSTGAEAGIGIGVSVFGLALIAALRFLLLRVRKQKQLNGMSDSGSTSVGTPKMGNFRAKRGMIQTQENMRLGLQNTLGMNENQISNAHGEENLGTTTSVSGPNIPPRSPSRALKGGSDNYF